MNKNLIISIAIPTYNGASTIIKTLDCLTNQILLLNENNFSEIEIVIKDDYSIDETKEILKYYTSTYSFINTYYSQTNVGMDNNFRDVAMLSKGDYIWFFGQDDLIEKNGIEKVLNLIKQHKPNIISINYKQVRNNGQIINNSVFNELSNKKLLKNYVYQFNSSHDYFKKFNSGPTFLPATIMKRDFWNSFDHTPFIGTAYVQAACVLLNMNRGNILAYTKPIIIGLVPENKWQSNGNSYLSIMIGSHKMEYIVSHLNENPFPNTILIKRKRLFLLRLYFLFGDAKDMGYIKNQEDLDNLFIIYQSKLSRFYICLIYYLDWKYHKYIFKIINLLKRRIGVLIKYLKLIF